MHKFSVTTEINVEMVCSDIDNFFELSASLDELLALAHRFGWVSIDNLFAEICIRGVADDCWNVNGRITAQIVQNCVVTGESVPEYIDFQIEERYVRSLDRADDFEVALDGAEPLKNGAIDIGELTVQSLGLAATSWPRVENAQSCYNTGYQDVDHPFAGLSVLRRQNR